jgi:hypothetical protein
VNLLSGLSAVCGGTPATELQEGIVAGADEAFMNPKGVSSTTPGSVALVGPGFPAARAAEARIFRGVVEFDR